MIIQARNVSFVALTLLLVPATSYAMNSEAACAKAWKKADVNGDGILRGAEVLPFEEARRVTNQLVRFQAYGRSQFMSDCQTGVITKAEIEVE